jgi:heme/copper-type cytochrome/quinol oxidase subunit 4
MSAPKAAPDESPCLNLADVLEEELAWRRLPGKKPRSVSGPENERLKAIHKRLHKSRGSALCLSGGGIRSATFALGVLQALADKNVLKKFDYLSTVSGGGYIGGWLSAWIKQTDDLDEAVDDLNQNLRDSPEDQRDPESQPIRHLRQYSNYLTPKLGITSGDTWTLVATVVRNIFLNWLMLIPLIAAVLMLPRLFVWAAISPSGEVAWWIALAAFVIAVILTALATAYSATDLPKWQSDRKADNKIKAEQPDKSSVKQPKKSRYFWLCLLPLVVSAWCISLGWFWLAKEFPPTAVKLSELIIWPLDAWFFILILTGASLIGGSIVLRRAGKWTFMGKEATAVVVTAAAGGVALWWALPWLFPVDELLENEVMTLNYLCLAPSLVLLVYLLMNFFFVGTLSLVTVSEDREWWARSAGWILVAALIWAAFSTLAIWGPIGLMALFQDKSWLKPIVAALGGATGIVTALVGHSTATAGPKQNVNSKSGPWLTLGAFTFILFLLVCVAFGTSWILAKVMGFSPEAPGNITASGLHLGRPYPVSVLASPGWLLFGLCAALGAFGWRVGDLINVNQFSLHAMYRARLIRAFLGASRGTDRKPHWFTGFDPEDNIDMHKLAAPSKRKLFHVVNTAMNLVSGEKLAWQERLAQSFTISPLHCGNWETGYRPSKEYALGIGLGTAITISGAAANPNMGYHSSPLVTFLMTLFNVRLGWWVANPGPPGKDVWERAGPRHAAAPLISEAFGNTTDRYTYVNLSDGGHFENLGLYEMVLRRCRHIVVVDAGRDTDYAFEDLGNAIRKIRIDFGIEIDIKINFVAPDKDKIHLARCAIGNILYNKVDKTDVVGELLYIKPVLKQGEPVDVYNYYKAHPGFPHETTNDQWFSESQLESYRMLGSYTVQDICTPGRKFETMEAFFEDVKERAKKLQDESARTSKSKASSDDAAGPGRPEIGQTQSVGP